MSRYFVYIEAHEGGASYDRCETVEGVIATSCWPYCGRPKEDEIDALRDALTTAKVGQEIAAPRGWIFVCED